MKPIESRTNISLQVIARVLVILALLWLPQHSFGCTLCLDFPERTEVDFLSDSHCVILARPTEALPYAYSVTETLRGAFDGEEIDLLVDTVTRRQLALNAQAACLLVQREQGCRWRNLGIVSQAYLPVVRRILLVGETWKGTEGMNRRWQFFLPLFGHGDPRIRQLAYLEMGRAPYAALRRLGRSVPRETYVGMLNDPKYLRWRSLAILLLAQSNDLRDQQHIRHSFEAASSLSLTTNLSAWCAAVIEIDGTSAIDGIDEHYLRRNDRSIEEIEAILQALSMHGSLANSPLRDRIVDSYRLLVQAYPGFAAIVAADLANWNRQELTTELAELLRTPTPLPRAEQLVIARYLKNTEALKEPILGP